MILLTPESIAKLWYDALDSELGIRVSVELDDVATIRFMFYSVRKDLADERLGALSLMLSDNPPTINLYKREEVKLP